MKDGYVIKSSSCGAPKKGELSMINSYTRRELKEDEVYVFSVVLCDNDIDRDYEMFTVDALHELAKLYVGKTGIIDHDMKSDNQTARIFSCCVEKVAGKVTKTGDPYHRLTARAYMPKSEKNSDFILDIDAGIRKEVSVGCSIGSVTCSVCGANIKKLGCKHVKGRKYIENGKEFVCHHILDNPTDAYEWSFVAVPAQKEAGVIKAFAPKKEGGVSCVNDVIKMLKLGEEFSVSKDIAKELADFIADLEVQAQEGKAYRKTLKREVLKLSSIVHPEVKQDVMDSVTDKMNIDELKSFKAAFEEKVNQIVPPKVQLASFKQDKAKSVNTEFQI